MNQIFPFFAYQIKSISLVILGLLLVSTNDGIAGQVGKRVETFSYLQNEGKVLKITQLKNRRIEFLRIGEGVKIKLHNQIEYLNGKIVDFEGDHIVLEAKANNPEKSTKNIKVDINSIETIIKKDRVRIIKKVIVWVLAIALILFLFALRIVVPSAPIWTLPTLAVAILAFPKKKWKDIGSKYSLSIVSK